MNTTLRSLYMAHEMAILSVRAPACMHVSANECKRQVMCVYVCVCACMRVIVSVFLHVMCVCLCVWVCVRACVIMLVSACTCVFPISPDSMMRVQ